LEEKAVPMERKRYSPCRQGQAHRAKHKGKGEESEEGEDEKKMRKH